MTVLVRICGFGGKGEETDLPSQSNTTIDRGRSEIFTRKGEVFPPVFPPPSPLPPEIWLLFPMASRRVLAIFVFAASICSLRSASGGSSSTSDVCPRSDLASVVVFGNDRYRCPAGFQPSPPLEVTGEFLDMVLSHGRRDAIYSILFHASWCPFSKHARHIYDALSAMHPQIKHLAIEESSALPSVFSRYGVHSLPTILFMNQTTRIRYQGSKDLSSLLLFYKKVTGLEPFVSVSIDEQLLSESKRTFGLWNVSPRDIFIREPYLALSILFICIRAFLYFFPGVLYQLKLFWVSYLCHLNMGILGGLSQHLEQTLHLIDLTRLWSKLRLSNKSRNFQKGANNARVWASSLTSVSLGESSSSRTASSDS